MKKLTPVYDTLLQSSFFRAFRLQALQNAYKKIQNKVYKPRRIVQIAGNNQTGRSILRVKERQSMLDLTHSCLLDLYFENQALFLNLILS
jgi:hypothetical protein